MRVHVAHGGRGRAPAAAAAPRAVAQVALHRPAAHHLPHGLHGLPCGVARDVGFGDDESDCFHQFVLALYQRCGRAASSCPTPRKC
eukprot:6377914-Prymnesium_polylepis.1